MGGCGGLLALAQFCEKECRLPCLEDLSIIHFFVDVSTDVS